MSLSIDKFSLTDQKCYWAMRDVTKSGNEERGTGNRERGSGNDRSAVSAIKIQNGGLKSQ